jgi:hypothetical protein
MNGKDPPAVPFATAATLLILVFLINRIAALASREIKRARVK